MASNYLGKILQVTCFGESHGSHVGAVLDGFPSGLEPDFDFMRQQMRRRRPGQSDLTTSRTEDDIVEVLSGIFENKSTGAPIALLIKNNNIRSADYEAFTDVYRPSHADFTYDQKYGFRDHRGGGRSSARITAPIVAAGALVQAFLKQQGIEIFAYVHSIYDCVCEVKHHNVNPRDIDKNTVRCPDANAASQMERMIKNAKADGDSLGGEIICVIKNVKPGLGEPFFGKLQADLAHAMMSINAVKGFEYGNGFAAAKIKGSENNDAFSAKNGEITTTSNNSGGIQGGITNGETIYFKLAFKPPASILKQQHTVNKQGEAQVLHITGRHDPCVLPRAVPIVETFAALVIGDHFLRDKIYRAFSFE